MKLGRNDLCHCGSGKKYKRCCRQLDIQNQRALQSISNPRDWFIHHSQKVTSHMTSQLSGHAAIQSAQSAWSSDDHQGPDVLFQQHALFDLAVTPTGPLVSETIAAECQLTDDEGAELTKALVDSHMSLLWVKESKRGKGVRFEDALTGKTFFVSSADNAKELEPMEVILGRVCQWQNDTVLLPGWEKIRFHGRKQAIETVNAHMLNDGFEVDAFDERVIWLRRQAAQVADISRRA